MTRENSGTQAQATSTLATDPTRELQDLAVRSLDREAWHFLAGVTLLTSAGNVRRRRESPREQPASAGERLPDGLLPRRA